MGAPSDPLDMTLREFLGKIIAGQQSAAPANEVGWVNIRDPQWPWRRIVDAAERGEVQVSRVGRRLLVRREDLDKWLDAHAIRRRPEPRVESEASSEDPDEANIQQMIAKAGLGHRNKRR